MFYELIEILVRVLNLCNVSFEIVQDVDSNIYRTSSSPQRFNKSKLRDFKKNIDFLKKVSELF